ncbi:MAG: hypothetical protein IKC08_04810 [Lentisphaeria bacterium]|nr:hypothetical protein [Lentisphaeria bacterium]
MNENILKNIRHILYYASGLRKGEKSLFLYDDRTEKIAELFMEAAKQDNCISESCKLMQSRVHGEEPPDEAVEKMLESNVIFCLTHNSLAHTQVRMEANRRGIRFLSMPSYTLSLLEDPALTAPYKEYYPRVEKMAQMLTESSILEITTSSGTFLTADLTGRKGNSCPGFTDTNHLLASPPDIEANIAPVEEKSCGNLLIDGSITCDEIGLLKEPVSIEVEKGKIRNFSSGDKKLNAVLEKMFEEEKRRVLAEIGIGFNEKAVLCGNMLVDEGTCGAIHFGFGSNGTIGGKNLVPFHLDFVLKKPTLALDGKIIMENGKFLYGKD